MKPSERPNCYLCGIVLDEKNRTIDHVPPKALFPRPFVDRPLTVPCCMPCNNAASNDEELFRLICTLGLNSTPEKTAVYEQRVIPNTFGKGRLRREITEIVKGMTQEWMAIEGIYALCGKAPIKRAPLLRVSGKVARGLLAYHYPEIQTHDLDFKPQIPKRGEELWNLIAHLNCNLNEIRLGGRVFHSLHAVVEDDPRHGVWIMTFHETIGAAVFHSPRK